MQRNEKDDQLWFYILIALILWMSFTSEAQPQALPKPAPVLLTEAEGNSLIAAHSDATKPSTKKHKYEHRVMEMSMPMGRTVRTEVFSMAPDKILVITDMLGMGIMQSVWDGKIGWALIPGTGTVLLDSAAVGQLKLVAGHVPTAPAVISAVPSATVRLYSLGQELIDGRPAKAILTVYNKGDSLMTYYDVETGLMAGVRGIRVSGQPIDTNSLMLYSDYKRIDGTMLPMKITVHMREHRLVTRIIEWDHKKIDAAKFKRPPAVLGLLAGRP